MSRQSRVDHGPYWATQASDLLASLETTESGLSDHEAEARLEVYGDNRLTAAHRGPFAEAVMSQFRNPLLWLLLFAAIVGATVGETMDSLIVLIILALGSLLSIIQESRAGRALEQLRERIALRARVVREGREIEVPATSIVPGDLLVLHAGTLVAADAALIQARDLFVGEAALTGEAFPVEKSPGVLAPFVPLGSRSNVVHMGTNVRSGTGRAVVVETGRRTSFGRIAERLSLKPPETEFQRGLRRFGYLLLTLMVILVFVVFAAGALRHHPPIDTLLFAVALAVGLAPEMLPAILATMLARGARRMSDRGVLVRRLEAIENLGNMDVFCTDKTGTLTEGEPQLEATASPAGEHSERVLRLASWNASLQGGLPSPLDRAIVQAVCGNAPDLPKKLDEIPFDFVRKRLSVLVEPAGDEALLITKGAASPVLVVCNSVRAEGETVVTLQVSLRKRLEERVASWSAQGIRVIAVASRPWSVNDAIHRDSEKDMTLEGFLTFRDPTKPGAAEAVNDLRDLGVRVKIISGDHHAVVAHVAAQIGVDVDEVVRGGELVELPEEALCHLVQHSDAFAEIDPTQKERIVVTLKKVGHVVAFMGDGINDAPAIHAADVGISVDGATDVAREAADFVLLDRDLATVRDGVKEGRATFANTLKYVLTTESANLGNMVSMAAAALFLPFLPLLAHQILLNNLLSDVPSAALSGDRVDPEMVMQPQRWDVWFIGRFMLIFGLISTAFDAVTFFALTSVFRASPQEFRTAWFAESLLTELFVLLVLRTGRRFWKSRPHAALLWSTLAIAVLTFAIPLSPLRGALGFVQLQAVIWASVLAIATTYVLAVEAVKRPILRLLARSTASKKRRWGGFPLGHRIWPR
jgi:Mg2+-importing ATPase